MCLAIAKGEKIFELLTHSRPLLRPGTRLLGGPTCKGAPGQWPVWFVAEVSGVVTQPIDTVFKWLHNAGLLAKMENTDVDFVTTFIEHRAKTAADSEVHVVLFERVHDVRTQNIDLLAPKYTHKLPHPRTSSLLAYLHPAEYWHSLVDSWIY
jgi:hypothetical protein